MLFLGSKDMNVYLIDVKKGKLCVVYEGHWSRVSSIYTIPGKDILVTLADSNIKVWDLEYDECIKNMNEHESLVVYCAVSNLYPERITTISQSLEYKQWNYITGQVKKAMILQVGHLIDKKKQEEDDFFNEEPNDDRIGSNNLLACSVSQNDDIAFLALSSADIVIYNL